MNKRQHLATRRQFITSSMLTGLACANADLMRARAAGGQHPDTAVILVWLTGGLSHMDTYDLKPDAPVEYRGDFRPINTSVAGIEVGELLPMHAKIADKFNLLRSLHHGFSGHDGAHKRVLTGRVPKSPTGFVNDAPSIGCIVNKVRARYRPDSLAFVSAQREGTNVDAYSQGSAYLGKSHGPFLAPGDPSQEDWDVPNLTLLPELQARFQGRRRLLDRFDRFREQVDRSASFESTDRFQSKALALLTSEKSRQAFDLSQEDEAVRNRYGFTRYGQRALLARRLIEAGTSFVNVVMESPGTEIPAAKNVVYNWDCHAVNCHVFDDARWRFPHFDQAVSGLIEDLYARGLDKKVMLVVTGEFGHTPRISNQKGTATGIMQPGRDHWPGVYSALVSGGGMQTGQVLGSSDSLGEQPKDRPLSPDHLWATVYRHLGIDLERTFPNLAGRPMPILPGGSVIDELL